VRRRGILAGEPRRRVHRQGRARPAMARQQEARLDDHRVLSERDWKALR
jgi:hypothetical protein